MKRKEGERERDNWLRSERNDCEIGKKGETYYVNQGVPHNITWSP